MSEIIEQNISEEAPQVVEAFVIDSDAKASWALQKIKEARADRDRWVEWYKAQIKKITEQTAFDTMNLERSLREYFETVPHKQTKTQESYTLPGGKLVLKNQNPEFVRDDKKVIEWLKANRPGEFVKVTETLDWDGLKKASVALDGKLIDENGEEIPGVEVIDRDPAFTVELKG